MEPGAEGGVERGAERDAQANSVQQLEAAGRRARTRADGLAAARPRTVVLARGGARALDARGSALARRYIGEYLCIVGGIVRIS